MGGMQTHQRQIDPYGASVDVTMQRENRSMDAEANNIRNQIERPIDYLNQAN
jgi:hypothetical protein